MIYPEDVKFGLKFFKRRLLFLWRYYFTHSKKKYMKMYSCVYMCTYIYILTFLKVFHRVSVYKL